MNEGNGLAQSSPTLLRPATTTKDREIMFLNYPNMPPQFSTLESSAPTDHHYVSTTWPLTADIIKNHEGDQYHAKRIIRWCFGKVLGHSS